MDKTIHQLPATGFLRIWQIIGTRKTNPPTPPLLPVGRSTWLQGVKTGRYPAPVKGLGKRITVWRVEDILRLIDQVSQCQVQHTSIQDFASETPAKGEQK